MNSPKMLFFVVILIILSVPTLESVSFEFFKLSLSPEKNKMDNRRSSSGHVLRGQSPTPHLERAARGWRVKLPGGEGKVCVWGG